MKKGISFFLGLGFLLSAATVASPVFNTNTYAEGDGCFEYGGEVYETFDDAMVAFTEEAGTKVVMTCDYETNTYAYVDRNAVLDLAGHTYDAKLSANYMAFYIGGGSTLTLDDTVGNGKVVSNQFGVTAYDGEANVFVLEGGELSATSELAALYLTSGSSAVINGGKVTAPSGETNSSSAVSMTRGSLTMNGGAVEANKFGVLLWHDSALTMNGGVIRTVNAAAVTGNGTTDPNSSNYGANTTITLNGGTVTSENSLAIYHPQKDGILTIKDGAMVSGKIVGVEIRAGSLNIEGGEISSSEEVEYAANPNGNGSTTAGAAVAVAQHTTRLPLTVTISGGRFVGPVAFSERNPQENGDEDIEKVTTVISGGTFVATNGDPIVVSEDLAGFIEGGEFSKRPSDAYVADGKDVFEVTAECPYVVDDSASVAVFDVVYLQPGEEYTYAFPNAKYARLNVGDEGVVAADGMTVRGVKAGEGSVYVNYGGLVHPMSSTYGVMVYEVEAAKDDAAENDAERDVAKEAAMGAVADLLKDGASEDAEFNDDAADKIKEAIAAGKEVVSKVELVPRTEEEVEELREEAKEALKDKGDFELAAVFDVDVNIYADGEAVGRVTKLGDKIALMFEIPESYLEAPAGYKRTFFVVREHGGEVEILDATLNGNVVSTESDLFSTYAIVYQDELDPTAPVTGRFAKAVDYVEKNSKVGVTMLAIGMLMLGVGLVLQGKAWRKEN